MNFQDVFEHLKQATREEIVKDSERTTPYAFTMAQIDEKLGTNAEIRTHILQGTEPAGKVMMGGDFISLSQTEFDKLVADVKVSKQIREQLGRIIRAEVDVILKEYKLIP